MDDKPDSIAGMLCLVLSHDELNANIVINLLQEEAVNIVKYNSVKGILLLISKLQPDAIFIDIDMPDLDDSEVTQELGQNNSKIAAPLILLGESKMKHELDPNLALRSDNLMLKPVSKDLLTRTLAKYSKSQVHFFDRALALRQVMGKDVFLLTMLKKFAKLCRGYICQFEAEQSSTDLALLAHTIKGAAAGLGFNRLAEAAKLLELHIKRTGGIKERALVSNLKLKLKQAESYLAIECQGD